MKKWGKALSVALALALSFGQPLAITAEAEESETDKEPSVTILNSDMSADIWGSDSGWTVSVDDWDATGASIKSFSYSSDQWMDLPSDGSDTGVNYWFGEGDGVLTFSQQVDIPAGTYVFSTEAMGEKSSFTISVGDEKSDEVSLTGYNNWLTGNLEFTAEEDLDNVTLAVSFDVSKDGWGYLNNVVAKYKNTGSSESGDEPGTGEDPDPTETPSEDTAVDADIYVEKVAGVDDNFITGADLSSYLAEKNSGVKFYDYEGNELDDQGFFNFLYQGGTNYARIRVWNDPKDENGNIYGGGNCDIEVAKKIGKWATNAGMKVLIDFHYSDFWADPGKQTAPKSMAAMSADEKAAAIKTFTENSLKELLDAGVNVGMVQIGNETNNGVCGEKSWDGMSKIFSAGSSAVRKTAQDYNKEILVAVHFTNPETSGRYAGYAQKLDSYGVDYDVFASSYYPYWHGTLDNLKTVLSNIASTYGKKVMVAETSYLTTFKDGDGSGNTEHEGKAGDAFNYDISVQGQANSVRAVVNTVAGIDGGIGVFYWEPAWIPVQVYDESADNAAEILAQNKEIWETYGSGWATSFSGSYDKDAVQWYGGSAVDNESWFDFAGHPLATARLYSYIRTGTTAKITVTSVSAGSVEAQVGENVSLPEKAIVKYSDGSEKEADVTWNEDELKKAVAAGVGTYTITGKVTVDGEDYAASVELVIKPVNNLVNPGFEDADMSAWVITDKNSCVSRKNDSSNVRSGAYCLHFWDDKEISYTVEQKVTLNKGVYKLGCYLEGGDAGENAEFILYAVSGDDKLTTNTGVTGWQNWANPEVTDIKVTEDGTEITVGVSVKAAAGAWGAFDDFYLYRTGDAESSEEPTDPQDPDEPQEPEITGQWQTKWGSYYYVYSDGTKAQGFTEIEGATYYFNSKNHMVRSSFVTEGDNTYYLGSDGKLVTGFMTKWGHKYYFNSEGQMQTGFTDIDGNTYFFDQKGKMVESNWIDQNGKRYYAKKGGIIAKNETITKWFKKYSFDENGVLIK